MIHFTLFSNHSTTWHPQGENIHRGGITTIFWNNLNSCKQRLTDSSMWLNKATSVNLFISFQFNLGSRANHVIAGQYFYMICWFTCRSNGVKWIIPCEVTLFGKNQIDINTIVNCSWTLLMTSTCGNICGICRFNLMSRDSLSSPKQVSHQIIPPIAIAIYLLKSRKYSWMVPNLLKLSQNISGFMEFYLRLQDIRGEIFTKSTILEFTAW